jgi:CO/xanthine dehydrogenase FAD-binding subunit
MSNWLIIIILALAVAGILYALYQRKQSSERLVLGLGQAAGKDYQKEREDARVAHLSVDDRAWEAASLERNLANQKLRDAPSE